jgi:hypothetical protein
VRFTHALRYKPCAGPRVSAPLASGFRWGRLLTVEDVGDFSGTSVAKLEELAARLPTRVDFDLHVYTTYNRGRRSIVIPKAAFDSVAKNLHRSLVAELPYVAPAHVHGFIKGRSTLTNAREHLDKPCVLRVDLREFFPSIEDWRTRSALQRKGLDAAASILLTQVITIDGRLPIGLSTSPYISNLTFEDSDQVLAEYCVNEGLAFTRYVDDMSFSGAVVTAILVTFEKSCTAMAGRSMIARLCSCDGAVPSM